MSARPLQAIEHHVLDFLPCPSWCDGHPGGQGVDDGWQASVHHIARTAARLTAAHSGGWTTWSGPVFVGRIDTYHEGTVDIGTPTICIDVNELENLQDVTDTIEDLLAAGLVLKEALR